MITPNIELPAAPKTFTFEAWQPKYERENSYRNRMQKDFAEFVAELIEAAGGSPAEEAGVEVERRGRVRSGEE